MAQIILPEQYPNKGDYQIALEDAADKCRYHATIMQESLDWTCYQVPSFEEIDRLLKMAESSIREARKIIRIELEGREANKRRQQQKTKEKYG
jgi:hypothetical protein